MFDTLAAKVGTSLTKSIRLEYCSQGGGGRLCHHDHGARDLEVGENSLDDPNNRDS